MPLSSIANLVTSQGKQGQGQDPVTAIQAVDEEGRPVLTLRTKSGPEAQRLLSACEEAAGLRARKVAWKDLDQYIREAEDLDDEADEEEGGEGEEGHDDEEDGETFPRPRPKHAERSDKASERSGKKGDGAEIGRAHV